MTIESPKYIEHLTNARGNSQRGCGQCDCQATGRASTDFGSGFCGGNATMSSRHTRCYQMKK